MGLYYTFVHIHLNRELILLTQQQRKQQQQQQPLEEINSREIDLKFTTN